MKNIHDRLHNPPAFPTGDIDGRPDYEGMTLRDYFAARALEGDWAAQDLEHDDFFDELSPFWVLKAKASLYYYMADAMLEVRTTQFEDERDQEADLRRTRNVQL